MHNVLNELFSMYVYGYDFGFGGFGFLW